MKLNKMKQGDKVIQAWNSFNFRQWMDSSVTYEAWLMQDEFYWIFYGIEKRN